MQSHSPFLKPDEMAGKCFAAEHVLQLNIEINTTSRRLPTQCLPTGMGMQLVAMRKRALEVAAQRQGASAVTVRAWCLGVQSLQA